MAFLRYLWENEVLEGELDTPEGGCDRATIGVHPGQESGLIL